MQHARALKKPVHLSFKEMQQVQAVPESRSVLALHLTASQPPVSSIIFRPPQLEPSRIVFRPTVLETEKAHLRQGYANELFGSIRRVFERLAYDYGKPVVHQEMAMSLKSENFFKKQGYSLHYYGDCSSAERVFKPVNHALNSEEKSALTWFKTQLESKQK